MNLDPAKSQRDHCDSADFFRTLSNALGFLVMSRSPGMIYFIESMMLFAFKMTTCQKIKIPNASVIISNHPPYCRPVSLLELLQMPTQSSCRQVAGRKKENQKEVNMDIEVES